MRYVLQETGYIGKYIDQVIEGGLCCLIFLPRDILPLLLIKERSLAGKDRIRDLIRKRLGEWPSHGPWNFRVDVRVLFALPSRSLSQDSSCGVEAPEQALIFRYPQSG